MMQNPNDVIKQHLNYNQVNNSAIVNNNFSNLQETFDPKSLTMKKSKSKNKIKLGALGGHQ